MKKAVWIVDDDASIRFVLERALQRASLPVQCFEHPSQVLAALERGNGTVQVRKGRHDDDRQLRPLLLHALQQIQPGQAMRIGHADIADQHQRLPVALPQRRQYL